MVTREEDNHRDSARAVIDSGLQARVQALLARADERDFRRRAEPG